MKNLLIVTSFILIASIQTKTKFNCVIQNLYKELNVPTNVRTHIASKLNEQNLNNNYTADSEEIYSQLIPFDFSTTEQIEEMLRDFESQPEEFKRAVNNCNLSMESTMQICKKKFKHCELIDKFTAAKTCPENHVRFNYAYCVPRCDQSVQPVDNDVFVCAKPHKSTRSSDLSLANSHLERSYRGLMKIAACPEGFTELHNDICVANCPYGWEDAGEKCLKPYFQEREYEFFAYAFQNDGEKIREESY